MAKAFNEREKKIIEETLVEKGREYFGNFGLKKTSIKDLTSAANIAQGTFYKFFGSKEELYFEILEREEEKIKEELLTKYLASGEITYPIMKEFLMRGLEIIESNSLLQRLYFDGEYELLLRKLPREKIENHIQNDSDLLSPLVEWWQKEGIMIEKDPKVISGVIRSLFLITLHKKEIGEEVYDDTLELMVDLVARGLIKKGE